MYVASMLGFKLHAVSSLLGGWLTPNTTVVGIDKK